MDVVVPLSLNVCYCRIALTTYSGGHLQDRPDECPQLISSQNLPPTSGHDAAMNSSLGRGIDKTLLTQAKIKSRRCRMYHIALASLPCASPYRGACLATQVYLQ